MYVRKSLKVDGKKWDKLKLKYGNVSQRIRFLISRDLRSDSLPKISRDDIKGFGYKIDHSHALQILGDIGIGKTEAIKNLIKKDHKHIYIVLDSHNEYDLPKKQSITPEIKESCRIPLPRQVAGAKGLFQIYQNQILSQKYPDNFVVIIEEAHRYGNQTKELLKESRKFVKCVAVTQEELGSFCTRVLVVK